MAYATNPDEKKTPIYGQLLTPEGGSLQLKDQQYDYGGARTAQTPPGYTGDIYKTPAGAETRTPGTWGQYNATAQPQTNQYGETMKSPAGLNAPGLKDMWSHDLYGTTPGKPPGMQSTYAPAGSDEFFTAPHSQAQTVTEPVTPAGATADTAVDTPGQMGATSQDYTLVDDRILGALKGDHPEYKAAASQEQRLSSQREYAITEEARRQAYQSGAAPGSEAWNAIMRKAQDRIANENRAWNALADLMTKLNDQALDRAIDQQKFWKDEERTDFKTMLDTVQDPKAKQWLLTMSNSGIPANELMSMITDDKGTIREEFRSEGNFQQVQRDAVDRALVNPDMQQYFRGADQDGDGQLSDAEREVFLKNPTVRSAVNKEMSNIFGAQTEPLSDADKNEEAKTTETRIQNFIDTGDYSKMTTADWKGLSKTQRADIQAKVKYSETELRPERNVFGNLDNLSGTDARSKFVAANPNIEKAQKGEYVTDADGIVWLVTEPLHEKNLSGDNHQLTLTGINTETGESKDIFSSPRYEDTWGEKTGLGEVLTETVDFLNPWS